MRLRATNENNVAHTWKVPRMNNRVFMGRKWPGPLWLEVAANWGATVGGLPFVDLSKKLLCFPNF